MTKGTLLLAVLVAVAACGRIPGRRAPAAPQPGIPPDSIVPPAGRLDTIRMPAAPAPPPLVSEVAKPASPARVSERCLLDMLNTDLTRSQAIRDPLTGRYTTYLGGGVVAVCPRQSIRITADSAESYEQAGVYYLIGTVRYREPKVSLDSDRLTYFRTDERVLVEGNVVAVTDDSSSMTGPRVEYFRAVRGVRQTSRMVATSRPTLRTFETDSLGRRQPDPVVLVADQIIGEGDTLFTATGRVELTRVDLLAKGDSGQLNKMRQTSRLMRNPVVESRGRDPFTLVGRVIDVFGRSRQVERVLALDSAVATSEDLTLRSDTLDLRISSNLLERAFAWGTRARAVTRDRNIEADSLDVRMPGQEIRQLHAIGDAYAETVPDTARIASSERDWLRGDTIIAWFDSTTARDSTESPTLRMLLSSGDASSFYQVPDNQGRKDKPGLNYVKGRQIRVNFDDREVQTVTVIDQARGIFLEARPDTSTGARRPAPPRPDTLVRTQPRQQ